MLEPEFQIFQCSNPQCRFRFPSNLTIRTMQNCPVCGERIEPQGNPFSNARRSNHLSQVTSSQLIEVVLDNLRSTLNVGSIFRTADGAGASHIYCCGTTPTPEHPKIKKTGLGAESFLAWTLCKNALDLIIEKKAEGFQIVSIEMTRNSASIFKDNQVSKELPILVIMGNEVSGIDPGILELSDHVLHIPMAGKKDSLNVAVAFGIAIYTLLY